MPLGVIDVSQRQDRQTGRLAQGFLAIEGRQLAQQDLERPTVGNDVVHVDQQPPTLGRQTTDREPGQRAAGQVERPPGIGAGNGRRCRFQVGGVPQVRVGQRRVHARDDPLRGLAVALFEDGAQRSVAIGQPRQDALQGGGVENAVDVVGHGNGVDRDAGVESHDEPQPFLGERERPQVLAGPFDERARRRLAAARGVLFGHQLGQAGNGGFFKEARHDRRRPELAADAGQDAHGHQRMTAESEKVVFHAYFGKLHQLRPNRDQPFLTGVARRRQRRGPLLGRGVRRRQRLAVDLAVGRGRESRQKDEVRRDHVVGQGLGEQGADLVLAGLIRVARPQVGGQPFIAGPILADHDQGFFDSVVVAKRGFDLAQLDAEPQKLDLMVGAAEKVKVAVGPVTDQVAGFVEPLARRVGEGVGRKPIGGQIGPEQIAARQTGAAQRQLALGAQGHRLAAAAERVTARVDDRPADGRPRLGVVWHQRAGRVGRVFGWTVQIVDLADPLLVDFDDQVLLKRFAGQVDNRDRARQHVLFQEFINHRGRRVDHVHLFRKGDRRQLEQVLDHGDLAAA